MLRGLSNTRLLLQKSSFFRRFSNETAEAFVEGATPTKEMPKLQNLDDFGRAYATGRRKTSVARVWLKEGSGQFTVNGKNFIEYFQPMQRQDITQPFAVSKTSCLYDVFCTVKGGGISGTLFAVIQYHSTKLPGLGQAGAVRLGISRALEHFNSDYRGPLRQGILDFCLIKIL